MFDNNFYKGKRVLITGHTGFKGSWMCKILLNAGATVIGYALNPPTEPSIFEICGLDEDFTSIIGDIRDYEHLNKVVTASQPEIVIHMAAQPIVRDAYKDPINTFEINVMGTVNILEAIRHCPSVRSFVNVTTDKVYHNREWEWGYRETDELNGYDPYSNSKSCSELVTASYKNSFFTPEVSSKERGRVLAITTCRAGNVIGGGDFANDRIIPDCFRAASKGRVIGVRNPYSTRPYQHVLEPVVAYLLIAQKQYVDIRYAGNYNIGPDYSDCSTTGDLVSLFCNKWNEAAADSAQLADVSWSSMNNNGPHEANFLKLDCSRFKSTFGWLPKWNLETAMEKTVEWYATYLMKGNVDKVMDRQIKEYLKA